MCTVYNIDIDISGVSPLKNESLNYSRKSKIITITHFMFQNCPLFLCEEKMSHMPLVRLVPPSVSPSFPLAPPQCCESGRCNRLTS